MKDRPGAILILGPGPWRIGAWTNTGIDWTETGLSSEFGPADILDKLPAAFKRAGCRGRPVLLALPSGDCLSGSIATSALPRKDRRRAMEYRLEANLPLAIEEVSTDFVAHNGRALGVCVRTEKITSTIEAVSRCGIHIAAISPTAILSFQAGWAATDASEVPDAIIWRSGEWADVFLLEGGELVQWHWVPATAADVGLILASGAVARSRPVRLVLRGDNGGWSAQINHLPNTHIIASDSVAMDDAALQTARQVLAEQAHPLVNFRPRTPGALPLPRPLLAAVAALVLLGLSLIGAAVLRANRYANMAAGFDDQEHRLFQRLFSGELAPISVESRLRSDAIHLQHPSSRQSLSSLTLLYNVLANLPPEARFQFDELQFDSGQATLHGRAGSLSQADDIAAALRKPHSLLVDDPQTQQLADGGVGFTIAVREGASP